MKKLNRITIMLGLVTLALASCGDASEEITDMIFNRNLSPLDVEATNVTETTTTLKWTPSSGATGYIVEIFANDSLSFEGSPQSTLTVESPSVFVSGLQYGTKYSARVQAITDGNDSRTSKWSGVYFLTNAHKLLKTPVEADIVDRSVTISWKQEEGYDVTTIMLSSTDLLLRLNTMFSCSMAIRTAVLANSPPLLTSKALQLFRQTTTSVLSLRMQKRARCLH